jgi:hypothetical protein
MKPVFVVGSGRSGTSVLLNTIRKTTDLSGHGEGHFYPLVLNLNRAVNQYFERRRHEGKNPQHMLHHVDVAELRDAVIAPMRDVFVDLYDGQSFVDKTPGPQGIAAIPFMQSIFPGMKVIYAKRRGIEVVRSAMLKFPHVDFEGHCENWATCMSGWKLSASRLSCDYVEIDQFNIARTPENVVEELAGLIGMDDDQKTKMVEHFERDRPQSSGDLNASARSIDEVDWTDEQIEIFRRVCGEMMDEFGYSESSSYFVDEASALSS